MPGPDPKPSVAVTVQKPGVLEVVYVTVATPLALVVAVPDAKVPHELPPEVLKVTVSFGTGADSAFVTVAVITDVEVPLAGTGFVPALTAT